MRARDFTEIPTLTVEQTAAAMERFQADLRQELQKPATGYHDARDSVREAAVRGQGTRTDRAYRRGLRGRGQR